MKIHILVGVIAIAGGVARADAPRDVVVHFGQPLPQGSTPAVVNVVDPDEVVVRKGGTVTFVVNGGGHGLAIHPVDKRTTRDDIAADLCQGGASLCNGSIATNVGSPAIVGTQNLSYDITDAKDRLIIHVGDRAPAIPRRSTRASTIR